MRLSGSFLPPPLLPTWDRDPLVVSGPGWVPGSGPAWGCCGCWQWPSPAAGGRPAARVRHCGAASAAPRPETLRARASATSSSMVGAGAGSGMKAADIPRPRPRQARDPGPERPGRELHPAHLDAQRRPQPSSHRSSAASGEAFMATPALTAPYTSLAPSSRLGIEFCT